MRITKIVLFFLFGAAVASSQVQITGSKIIMGTTTSNACPISPCSIATGGTGATTAAGALANLGAVPAAGGTISGQLGFGSKSYVQEVNGDLWITANAYYDGTNWQRVDITKASFGLQLQGTNNFPYESNQGGTLWVASAHANPIDSTYGSTYGWRIGWTIQSTLTMVLGGAGVEIDGDGSVPYGRFFHNTISSVIYTGILTNEFVDFSGVDDATKPSWLSGIAGDSFQTSRAAAGAGATWNNFFKIDSSGNPYFPTIAPSSTSCMQMDSTGKISPTASACGSGGGSGTVTSFAAPSASWPSWLVPTVTNSTTTPSLAVAASSIPNSALANSSTTVNGATCTLGSSCTVTASASLTVGTTTVTSGTSGYILYDNAGVLGNFATTGSVNVVMSNTPLITTPNVYGLMDLLTLQDATSSANSNSSELYISGAYYNGGSQDDSWSLQDVVHNTGSSPATYLTITHTGSSGTAMVQLPLLRINGIAPSSTSCLQINTSGDVSATGTACGSGGGTGITVGTTSVTSGTSGYILYDNAGVLGNLATTGTGNAVLASAPVLSNAYLGSSGTATSSTNYSSTAAFFDGSYYNSSALVDQWAIQNVMGTGTAPTSSLTFFHTGSAGAATVAFPSIALNGVAMSSVPKMVWSASIPVLTAAANVLSADWAPSSAITITQFAIFLDTSSVGCSTGQTYGIYDATTSAWLGTVTLYNSQASTTLGLTAAVTAGDVLSFGIQSAATGCSTPPANASVLAEYRMQ
jgi:hypothetical protein